MKNSVKVCGLFAFLAMSLVMTGCAGVGGFADVIKNADTAHKEIKAEFTGWNAHFTYESRPLYENLTPAVGEGVTIVPETTLKVVVPPK